MTIFRSRLSLICTLLRRLLLVFVSRCDLFGCFKLYVKQTGLTALQVAAATAGIEIGATQLQSTEACEDSGAGLNVCFVLTGVVVHAGKGGRRGGHYYSFVRIRGSETAAKPQG